MKKNIWVINQYIETPPDFYGHRHFNLAKYWCELSYNVTLINGSYSHIKVDKTNSQVKNFELKTISKDLKLLTVKIPKYGTSNSIFRFWNMINFMIKLFFLPLSKLDVPDIIIVSSTSLFPIINGYFLRKKFKKSKLILEIRDIWPLTLIELNGTSKWHPIVLILGFIEKFGYKKADYITSTLNNADKHIEKIISTPFKFKWIGNGINPEQLSRNINSSIKLPLNKFNITYVGTLGTANSMEYLVNAAKKMQNHTDIHFNIIGTGYQKDKLKTLASGLQNITFFGKISNDEVFDIYGQSDALYLSWRYKNIYKYGISANKIFEYLLSAKPIIMSGNHIENDPITMSGAGIVTESENSEEIIQAILKLKKLTLEERIMMGNNGKNYVLKNHNYQILAKNYLDLIESL
jgi:hypothetical protein